MEKLNRKLLHSNIVYTFIFGVLWGLLEIIANEFLVPNNIFIKGLIFSFIAVFVLIFSKKIIDYKFSLLIIATIALLMIFASRGYSLNIMIAIFSEALIAEIIFLSFKFRLTTTMAIGALIFLYSFIHGLIFHGSLPGSYIVYLYNNLFSDLTGISASKNAYFLVLLFFWFVSLAIGIATGWLSFRIVNSTQKRVKESIEHYILSE